MPRRPTPKSLELLNVTLQKLEQTGDPGKDGASMADLKRVLVNRIADLELSKSLVSADAEFDEAHEPADLVLHASINEEGHPEMALDTFQIDKLN